MLGFFRNARRDSDEPGEARYLHLPLLSDQQKEQALPYHFESIQRDQMASLMSMPSSSPPGIAGPAGAPPGAASTVERRRLAQLQQLINGQQLTPTQLRRLYRLIDADNDGKLRHQELQQGLVAMGFSEAASPEVIGKLLMEIDTDKSGTISESEFIEFFQRYQLDKLQKKVSALGKGRASMIGGVTPGAAAPPPPEVTIDATIFSLKGVEGSTKLCVRKKVSPDKLSSFLQNHVLSTAAKDQDHHAWLDIVGFSEDTLAVLSLLVGVDRSTLEDVYVMQAQKVEFVAAQESAIGSTSKPSSDAPSLHEGGNAEDDGPRLLFSPSTKNINTATPTSTSLPPTEENKRSGNNGESDDDDDNDDDDEEAPHPHDSVRLHMLLHSIALVNCGLVDGSLSRRTVREISGLLKCRCLYRTKNGGYMCCPNACQGGGEESRYGVIDRAVREKVLRNARALARSFYSPSDGSHAAAGEISAGALGGGGSATPATPGLLANYPSAMLDDCLTTGAPSSGASKSASIAPAPPPPPSKDGPHDHASLHVRAAGVSHFERDPPPPPPKQSELDGEQPRKMPTRTMSTLVGNNQTDHDDVSVALSEDSEARRRAAKVCGCIPAAWCGAGHGSADAEAAGPLTLASREHLNRLPPDLHIEQVSIIVVNDRLVITLRPNDSISKGNPPPPTTSPRTGSGQGPHGAFNHDSVISILFEGLKQRIKHCGDSGMHLYTSSIKALALDQADAILQFSASVRDELREWHSKLEHEILTSAMQLHAIHLFSLQKMTSVFLRQMEPLRAAIQANNGKGFGGGAAAALMNGLDFSDNRSVGSGRGSYRGGGGGGGAGSATSHGHGPSLLESSSRQSFRLKNNNNIVPVPGALEGKMRDNNSSAVMRKRRGSNGMASVASAIYQQQQLQAAAAAAQSITLNDYFNEEAALITEIGDDLSHMVSDVSGMKETCDALQTMRASLQSDGQNRILFVLTGFTVLATPLTILTGFYGMNCELIDDVLSAPLLLGFVFLSLFSFLSLAYSRPLQFVPPDGGRKLLLGTGSHRDAPGSPADVEDSLLLTDRGLKGGNGHRRRKAGRLILLFPSTRR
jgi:Mg2+ and Co2+ transporter CorA